MPIDYNSLLIASASSCVSILLAILVSSSRMQKESYQFLIATGVGLATLALICMGLRNGRFDLSTLVVPFTILVTGLSFIYASIRRFLGKSGFRAPIVVGLVSILVSQTPYFIGLMGLGGILINVVVSVILFLCALEFMRAREDSRKITLALAGLFLLMSASFLVSATMLTLKNEWIRYPVEDAWWDRMDAISILVGVTSIGALILTLQFGRAARRHRVEANTDPLTGVLNRRALFERFAETDIVPDLPVLQFDLDHFKQINDHLGHAQGDATLQAFAGILSAHRSGDDVVARIGGEEFCMVLPGRSRQEALVTAERIRTGFAGLSQSCGLPGSIATVSVGLATGGKTETFSSVLSRADSALYKAKNAGRNVVCQARQPKAA